jgi:hypothetical protein
MGPLTEQHEEIVSKLRSIQPEEWIKIGIVAVVSLFLLLLLTSPWWHDIVGKHETAAVRSLEGIHTLEVRYYADHTAKGFSCKLEPLRSYAAKDGTDPAEEALGGMSRGYTFSIVRCVPEEDGVVSRYAIEAVPVKPGDSGVRAICTDQTGQVYYDQEGDGEACLKARMTVPKK